MVTTKTEQYIETIYEIARKKGYAKVKDVSQSLGIGLSAVSEMFKKLDKGGYINYEKYGGATLTKKGKKVAVRLSKKHKALQDFLIVLGVDEKVAYEEACEIEHVITRETMDRLKKFVDFINLHNKPLWLERFKKYYDTGKLSKCPKTIEKVKDKKTSDNKL